MRRIALEITRSSIRVLAVEGRPAQPRIRTFVVEPLAGEPSREVLKSALALGHVAKAQLISAIPREQAITRLLKLPTTRPDELAQMVALSGKAQLPYPPDQAVMDFHVVDQQAGMSTVQLVACHREVVDRHTNLLEEAGLDPIVITPSSWGLLAWYQRLGRSPEVREPVLVINVDEDRTDLVLIRQGRLVFSRSLSQGLREWQTGAEGVGPLAQEIEWSLSSLRKELPGVEAHSLILTGCGELDQWKGFFESRLGKPVIVRSVWGSLRAPQRTESINVSPAVVLGLAMAERLWLINLLPLEARHAQRHRHRMRQLTLTGVLVLSALLLGAGLLLVSVSRQERRLLETVKVLKTLESVTEQTERKERDVNLIEEIVKSRRRTAAMLAELFRLTPKDVFFETLVFERSRGELVVRGSAPATREVLDYIRGLEQSDQWDQVELRYSARRSVSAGARTDFEIVLRRRAS